MTAWVCLVVTLALGAVPARGLVLCLGPEGSVSVELSCNGERCGGCAELEADGLSAEDARGLDDCTNCPCTDIPMVGAVDTTGKLPKQIEASFFELVALEPVLASRTIDLVADRSGSACAAPPRCPDTLVHLCTVVLHL